MSTIHRNLSRRERQIMDILYRRGSATAAEVQAELPEAPGYSAVRAMLRTLEQKGHIRHTQEGPRYVFRATVKREDAREKALSHLLSTFFDDSAEEVVATLLDVSGDRLSDQQLEEISGLIEQARREGR